MRSSNVSDQSPDKGLFFATVEAERYDATINFVNSEYSRAHLMLRRLVLEHVRGIRTIERPVILDVGSGTGAEIISLLQQCPDLNALAVDDAPAMNAILREKLLRTGLKSRVKILQADVRGLGVGDLQEHLDLGWKGGFLASVSALTIHHFTRAEKEDVYKLMFQCLAPGGMLVNADLFSFASSTLSDLALAAEIGDIREGFNNAIQEEPANRAKLQELCDHWVKHYEQENRCSSLEEQAEYLSRLGAIEVGCPFRVWQNGVLCGRKSGDAHE